MNPTPGSSHRSVVLVTVAGQDSPGITSALTEILSHSKVEILDIGQSVIHGWLSLSILFELPPGSADKAIIKDLLFKATEMGLKLEFKVMAESELPERTLTTKISRYAITLIADRVSAASLHHVTGIVAKHRLNIDRIERLSEGEFGCVEMLVSSPEKIDSRNLKADLLGVARQEGVDIALQAEGLYRRTKRMIVFDMDSTLIQAEVIDEFARELGRYDEVAAITERAMGGKMDYDESLKLRCAQLQGLDTEAIDRVFSRIQLTPGAQDLIAVLKKLGYKIALISGGFTCVAERIKDRLGIDYADATQLEIVGGKVTDKIIPPIVNAQRKADLLELIAQQEKIQLDQVIAVGDGANDLLMLERAGLGIAFNAKPAVREKAQLALSQKNMSAILYLLGISSRDLAGILR